MGRRDGGLVVRALAESAVTDTYRRLRQGAPRDAQFDASKLLWHTEALNSWLKGSLVSPVTLELDVSLVCNDRCPTCVHGFAHGGRFLSMQHIAEILAEASDLGVRGLTLSGGGEPLGHPDIGRI